MNISLNPGVNVTLYCLVQNGGPADTIQWFIDDQPIRVRQRHSSSPRESLRLPLIKITETDAGRYECRISKGAESDTDVYYLNVEGKYYRDPYSTLRIESFQPKRKIRSARKKGGSVTFTTEGENELSNTFTMSLKSNRSRWKGN